ncbi:Serine-aspartate repeat-containing protein D precursor [Allorhodopirellula heiligendammensis]|uniref:Serine-aspartate repeat-containing protein D n=2 Tax=Allorhodopirellula heiligendammensis TaxID=2714739 RepID=A0A5C6C3M4_9BACT|nr:Serine-aspartate repeat-containing protein D precursor [Allorhodopirellula heiligendammensis]
MHMKKKRSRSLTVQPLESRRLLAAVDIPDDLTGDVSALVSVPVNIDDAAAVRGAEIRLSYDTDLLDLDPDAITAGSVWTGLDTQVTASVDDAAGTVTIFIAASAALPTGSGSLVILPFSIAGTATVGDTTVLDLTEVSLNEGQIPVTPTPVPGSDATDGLITVTGNSGNESIGGFVYADTNTNNTPELVEGIPGVVITLTNVATGETLQTTTDATGRYDFADLSPATYRIEESQPIAYLEGGVNELSVTIVVDQTIADQNFRELGLLPQYVYNRLHTTVVQPVGSTAWTDTILQINTDAAATDTTTNTPAVASNTDQSSSTQTASDQSQAAPAGEPLPELELSPVTARLLSSQSQVVPVNVESGQRKTDDDAVARDQALASMLIW